MPRSKSVTTIPKMPGTNKKIQPKRGGGRSATGNKKKSGKRGKGFSIQKKLKGKHDGFFPLGVYTSYLVDYRSREILHLDDAVEIITGIPRKEILNTSFYEIFSRLITPDILRLAIPLEKAALQHLSANPTTNVVVNLEYNIRPPKQDKKRILIQVTPAGRDKDGFPKLLHGYITDITHIIPGGPPRMTVLVDNQLTETVQVRPDEIYGDDIIPLTQRELSVLLHKRRGLRTKEIAKALQLKELTVYSVIRDLKKKTGMDILPLIYLLEQKGTL